MLSTKQSHWAGPCGPKKGILEFYSKVKETQKEQQKIKTDMQNLGQWLETSALGTLQQSGHHAMFFLYTKAQNNAM